MGQSGSGGTWLYCCGLALRVLMSTFQMMKPVEPSSKDSSASAQVSDRKARAPTVPLGRAGLKSSRSDSPARRPGRPLVWRNERFAVRASDVGSGVKDGEEFGRRCLRLEALESRDERAVVDGHWRVRRRGGKDQNPCSSAGGPAREKRTVDTFSSRRRVASRDLLPRRLGDDLDLPTLKRPDLQPLLLPCNLTRQQRRVHLDARLDDALRRA